MGRARLPGGSLEGWGALLEDTLTLALGSPPMPVTWAPSVPRPHRDGTWVNLTSTSRK